MIVPSLRLFAIGNSLGAAIDPVGVMVLGPWAKMSAVSVAFATKLPVVMSISSWNPPAMSAPGGEGAWR